MALDYSNPESIVNFRDVGVFVNLIANRTLLREGVLYRGGTLKYVDDLRAANWPRTVLCLQKAPDPVFPSARQLHFPISHAVEKYDTSRREVRAWLRRILEAFAEGIETPVYVHCLSGKDRTGVVIATLLSILSVPTEVIIEEYLLSEGETSARQIEMALDGVTPIKSTFPTVRLDGLRSQLAAGTS